MSAMTAATPGAKAARSCWPVRPALAMSISAGSAMTTAGKCCGSATGAIPFGKAAAKPRSGFPGGHGHTGAGLRPAAWRVAAGPHALLGVTTSGRITSLRSAPATQRRPPPANRRPFASPLPRQTARCRSGLSACRWLDVTGCWTPSVLPNISWCSGWRAARRPSRQPTIRSPDRLTAPSPHRRDPPGHRHLCRPPPRRRPRSAPAWPRAPGSRPPAGARAAGHALPVSALATPWNE